MFYCEEPERKYTKARWSRKYTVAQQSNRKIFLFLLCGRLKNLSVKDMKKRFNINADGSTFTKERAQVGVASQRVTG